jgi:hypothetical protein
MSRPQSNALYGKAIVAAQRRHVAGSVPHPPALAVIEIAAELHHLQAAGWAVGFGMGYRRGVNDAKTGDIIKAGHQMNAE